MVTWHSMMHGILDKWTVKSILNFKWSAFCPMFFLFLIWATETHSGISHFFPLLKMRGCIRWVITNSSKHKITIYCWYCYLQEILNSGEKEFQIFNPGFQNLYWLIWSQVTYATSPVNRSQTLILVAYQIQRSSFLSKSKLISQFVQVLFLKNNVYNEIFFH
jgi:hypothetical protein